jgi:hypothetical protein
VDEVVAGMAAFAARGDTVVALPRIVQVWARRP